MHKQAMEMAKWAMDDACAKGYDCMTSQDWDDFKDCMTVAEKAIKADYYYHLVCEMKDREEYKLSAEEYKGHTAEELRDLDRAKGKLYYSEPMRNENPMERARRFYTENRDMNDNSQEGKKKNMENLDSYMRELAGEVSALVSGMDTNEKNMVRAKLQALASKVQ